MSNSNLMPKFDFSKSTVKTTEELEALAPKRGESKFFRPGRHEVVIAGVEYTGTAKDPNWGKLTITYGGTGEKTIKDFVLIPFSDIKYGEKQTVYPFKKLQNLVAGLGLVLTPENMGDVMTTLFKDTTVLTGLHLIIEVGYQNGHLKFSRNGADESVVNIVEKNGDLLTDGVSKEALIFSDADSALAYAEQKGLKVDRFVNVIGYDKSATPNKGLGVKKANW